MLEREYVPAPCRVIYTHGEGFTAEAQDHHRAIPLVRDLPPEKPAPVAAKGIFRRPEPPRRERPAVDAQPVRPVKRPVDPRILVLHEEGTCPKDISMATRRSLSCVYNTLHSAGVSFKKPKPEKQPSAVKVIVDADTIIARRIAGESYLSIAKDLGYKRERIRNFLLKQSFTNCELAAALLIPVKPARSDVRRGNRCMRGHELIGDNVKIGVKRGKESRRCRICARVLDAANKRAKHIRRREELAKQGIVLRSVVDIEQVRQLSEAGMCGIEIGEKLGLHKDTVYRRLRQIKRGLTAKDTVMLTRLEEMMDGDPASA